MADEADEDGTAAVFDNLTEGDRILYNEKQQPLTVIDVRADAVQVEGPQGGRYLLFTAPDDPDTVLESTSGNREYAREITDLRVVGEWKQIDTDAWEHTQTGAQVALEQTGAGYWTLSIDNFAGELPDIPQYGFTSKEIALDEAEQFMEDHPEG